jgi:dihydrofolate reductase
MKKILAAINMTLDGFCDHTLIVPDDETHQHYNDLLKETGELLSGRTTYQLMEDYWPLLAANPSGNKVEDEFAVLMDNSQKVVFSHTLESVPWKNSRLATGTLEEEITKLKQQSGKPGLIAQAANLNLIDEYQIMVHR